jgi:ribose-phosphate pyrophosphokinase
VAAGSKRRLADDVVIIDAIVGDVAGKDVIILDDEIATAGSIIELTEKLREEGVGRISVACTHGLFTGPAAERLAAGGFDEIVTTNTVPSTMELPNLTTLSVAPLFAEAIRRINTGESISSLFSDEVTYG